MDCEKCPMRRTCEAEKKIQVASVIKELRPQLEKILAKHCPLNPLITQRISVVTSDYLAFLRLKRFYEALKK